MLAVRSFVIEKKMGTSLVRHLALRVYLLILLSFMLATLSAKGAEGRAEALVAVADVHGDFDDFAAILQRSGVIDAQHHWIGHKATLVQLGDVIDRGPKPREAMDLLMALEKEAPKAGGQVISLLGNHEMMNIMGDLRYVATENYASFSDSKSDERRKAAYQQYLKWRNGHAALLAELPQPMELTEAEWMARHPVGFVEHRQAFSPDGNYGKWLREHLAIAKVGDVIFLHGGIHPDLAHLKIDTINAHIRDEIKAFDAARQYLQNENVILPFFTLQETTTVVQAELTAEHKSRVPTDPQRQATLVQFLGYGGWLSVRPDGPLWFRGYDQWSDDEGGAQVAKVLQAFNASHIVVGHTVQKGGRIRPRFNNRVFLIDTGMLSSYYPGGRASALEICGDAKFTAEYMDQQTVLLDSAVPSSGSTASPAGAAPETGKQIASVPAHDICFSLTTAPQ